MRQRLRASAPAVALGLAIGGVTAYVLRLALDTTSHLNDEYANVITGRGMARDPAEIFSAGAAGLFRGPERLTSVLLAAPDAVWASAPEQLRAGHVILALAYALSAVPAYALLRGLDVPRWPAAGLAAAAIVGPWMVFGATLLNVTVAAPLTIAFAWAAWRAVVRPSVAAELQAVAAAALMTTARASHAAFFVAAVVAAIAAAWWTRAEDEGLARLPARVLRRNPVIAGVTVVAAVVVAVVGPRSLAGSAYEDAVGGPVFPLDQLGRSLGWTTAVLAIATGFIAVPIGGAWAVRQLVRPASVRTGAFAVLGLSLFVIFVWLMMTSGAEQQERYAAALGPLPVIALGAALFRREASVVGTAILGVLGARAIATQAIEAPTTDPLSYFFSPAQLFFSKVVIGRLTVVLPGDQEMVTIATLGAAAVAVLFALLAGRRAVAYLAVACVLALGVVSGAYTLRKYEPATQPGDLDAMAWLDRAVDGQEAVFWNYQWAANAADRNVRTTTTLYHNATPCCSEVGQDLSGFVRPDGRVVRRPVPRFVAGHDGYRPLVFAAVETARPDAYGAQMRVERFADDPPRVAAAVRGAGIDGSIAPRGRWATIDAFAALRGRCLDVMVYNPAEASGRVGFAYGPKRGTLRPGESRWVRGGAGRVFRRGAGDASLFLGEIHFVGCDDPPRA